MILLTTGLMGCESLFVSCLDTGIGVYNGLFHSTAITHSFDLFVYIIGAIILLLTAFYPRRLIETSNNIEEISVRSAQKTRDPFLWPLFPTVFFSRSSKWLVNDRKSRGRQIHRASSGARDG